MLKTEGDVLGREGFLTETSTDAPLNSITIACHVLSLSIAVFVFLCPSFLFLFSVSSAYFCLVS